MRSIKWAALGAGATAAAAVGGFLFATRALAHCDTLSGPVISAARTALDAGDVTPVLKWVKPEQEAEIKALFKKVLAVRAKGGDAKELADRAFFENLVRVHRAGEGAPFTGLIATPSDPGLAAADEALETGNLAALQKRLGDGLKAALEEKFRRVAEAKPHADENVAKGRAYVAAYVEFVHFVERLEAELAPNGAPHAHPQPPAEAAHVH
jgi:hypothetical protein